MIFLHAGLHKTGSTSIQRWLSASQSNSRRGAVAYFPESYWELLGRPRANWVRKVTERSRSQDVILSCEQTLGSGRLCYQNLPERIEILAEAFDDCPITLIVFLRPQLPWLESMYAQVLQVGKGSLYPATDFLSTAMESPYLHWNALVDSVAKQLKPEQIHAVEYSPRTAIEQFADLCHISSLGFDGVRSNKSVSAIRGHALSELANDPELDRRLLRHLLQSMVSPAQSARRSPFTEHQQQAVLDHFREDWELVSHREEAISLNNWDQWHEDEKSRPLDSWSAENVDNDLFNEYLEIIRWTYSAQGWRIALHRRLQQLRHERADLRQLVLERTRRWFSRA